MIKIILENKMEMDLELDEKNSPITVSNFLKLVNEKYYDRIVFHRIIKDFMAQTGGYFLDGNNLKESKKVDSIKGEFNSNGVLNNIKHLKGVISMARTSVKDSASSQFFICLKDSPHLDNEYASFGKCVGENSFKTLEYLNNVSTANIGGGLTDFPIPVIKIESIKVIK